MYGRVVHYVVYIFRHLEVSAQFVDGKMTYWMIEDDTDAEYINFSQGEEDHVGPLSNPDMKTVGNLIITTWPVLGNSLSILSRSNIGLFFWTASQFALLK
jgi:hypothetical protein